MKFKECIKYIACLGIFFSGSTIKPVDSAIITVPLNYTTEVGDNQDLSLVGSLTIDTSIAGASDRDQNVSLRSNPQAIPAWVTNITLTLSDADTSDGDQSAAYSKSDFGAWVWDPKETSVGSVDFTTNLVPQYDDIGFLGFGGLTSIVAFMQDTGEDEFQLTSTPMPFPFLAFLGFFNIVKKLKTIKKS